MRVRPGFTLLEVMAAVAISSIVALLAFTVARVGFDTEARVSDHNSANTAEVRVRQILADALRHPPEGGGAAMNDTLLIMRDNTVAFGHVVVSVQDTGLVVQDSTLTVVFPGVTAMQVHVLDRTRDEQWLSSWNVAGRMPAAVRFDFPNRPPIIVHTALEQVR